MRAWTRFCANTSPRLFVLDGCTVGNIAPTIFLWSLSSLMIPLSMQVFGWRSSQGETNGQEKGYGESKKTFTI
ncbi:hypothetical protein ARMA_2660 [Ardenticatena maritima]|uniref:Uncharacterized protein n=1 Tax=Ardenticatena maritima TaxID=872965 RepID=A0A0M9UDP8_9CHLR|nr:hypothetical protein ARMA_2660 [Ardenticatena maritima]